jgi:hypothetical protein
VIKAKVARLQNAERVMFRDVGDYSARNSSKGALLEEATRVFQALAAGATLDVVRDGVLRGTLLTQRSTQNRRRIWTTIHHRYLQGESWLTDVLTKLSNEDPYGAEYVSVLYLLYALRDRLTFDFVTIILWQNSGRARTPVSRNDVLDLLAQSAATQPQIGRWSEATRVKLAGSLLTALRDFGLLEGQQKKILVQMTLPLSTAEALVRVLVREGLRGRQIIEDRAWRLFLLREADVVQVLSKLANAGVLRFEKAGATVVLETPTAWEAET